MGFSSIPCDILREVFDAVCATNYSPPSGLERFEDDLDEGLFDPPTQDNEAHRNLAALSLVCRSWTAPAQKRMFKWVRLRTELQATRFIQRCQNSSVGEYVKGLWFGQQSQEHLISEDSFVNALLQCPKVAYLLLSSWSFENISLEGMMRLQNAQPSVLSLCHTFRLDGTQPGASVSEDCSRLSLESFCRLLCLMPSLRVLSFGFITNVNADISDLPDPPFRLRSLGVSDDWSLDFHSYSWLLRSSQHTIKTIYLHWITGRKALEDLDKALEHVGLSLNYLYLNGVDAEGSVRHCPNLIHFKESAPAGGLHSILLSPLAGCVARLQQLSISCVPYGSFLSDDDIEALINTVENHPAFIELRKLAIGVRDTVSKVPASLAQLRQVCEHRGIVLDCFSDNELRLGPKCVWDMRPDFF